MWFCKVWRAESKCSACFSGFYPENNPEISESFPFHIRIIHRFGSLCQIKSQQNTLKNGVVDRQNVTKFTRCEYFSDTLSISIFCSNKLSPIIVLFFFLLLFTTAAIYYFESALPISWQRYGVTSGAKGQAECRVASGWGVTHTHGSMLLLVLRRWTVPPFLPPERHHCGAADACLIGSFLSRKLCK